MSVVLLGEAAEYAGLLLVAVKSPGGCEQRETV